MSAESAAAVRTWNVGRYTCTLTVPQIKPGAVASCSVEWAPTMPERLTATEIRAYRVGRDQALASISAQLGIKAGVIDL